MPAHPYPGTGGAGEPPRLHRPRPRGPPSPIVTEVFFPAFMNMGMPESKAESDLLGGSSCHLQQTQFNQITCLFPTILRALNGRVFPFSSLSPRYLCYNRRQNRGCNYLLPQPAPFLTPPPPAPDINLLEDFFSTEEVFPHVRLESDPFIFIPARTGHFHGTVVKLRSVQITCLEITPVASACANPK